MAKKKFYETDAFLTENEIWKKKLANAGYNDIEKSEQEYVVRPQEFAPSKEAPSGENYYDFCQAVLRGYVFKRDLDRMIFELHTEGKSLREVEDALLERGKTISYRQISRIIDQIKADFKR